MIVGNRKRIKGPQYGFAFRWICTKTVLGNPGTMTPITPRARHSTANTNSSQRASAGRGGCSGTGGKDSVCSVMLAIVPGAVRGMTSVILDSLHATIAFDLPQ